MSSTFSKKDLDILKQVMTKVEIAKDTLVIEQFTEGDSFYFIESGLVRVWKYLDETKEDSLVLGELFPGDFFGEIALIDAAPRTVNIETREDSSLYVLTRESFERLIQTNPTITLTLMKILTARVRNAEQRENQILIEKNKELRKQNETLEEMVKERTAKLTASLKLIQEDLETAKTIQRNILPLHVKQIANYEFASQFSPMSEVGGDIFDVCKIGKNKIRLFLADATGHGVQAALITMAIKAEVDHLKRELTTPKDMLLALNQIFIDRYGKRSTQFTAVIADILLDQEKLVYANAGHNAPYLYSSETLKSLDESGVMLGLEKNVEYQDTTLDFSSNSSLFLISDGYLEQENSERELLGENRLQKNLQMALSSDNSLATVCYFLMEEFHKFRGNAPMMDDVTILALGSRS